MGPPTKVDEIRRISFDWRDPDVAKFRRAPTKCVKYPLRNNFAPRKSRLKFTPGHLICHQSIGHSRVSTDNSVVTVALECFVSEITLVLYRKCHFCTYPRSSFTKNLEMFSANSLTPAWLHRRYWHEYRISSNRSPRPLLAQLCQTPGLYSRPGLY